MTQKEAEQFVHEVMVRLRPWEIPDADKIKWGAELILFYESKLRSTA